LLYQAEGTQEDSICLSIAEIFFQRRAEPFRILDEFSFSLFQALFSRAEYYVDGHFINCVKQFLYGTCNFFNSLQKGFAVSNLIRDSTQDLLQTN
jgi:hypothetical protein